MVPELSRYKLTSMFVAYPPPTDCPVDRVELPLGGSNASELRAELFGAKSCACYNNLCYKDNYDDYFYFCLYVYYY